MRNIFPKKGIVLTPRYIKQKPKQKNPKQYSAEQLNPTISQQNSTSTGFLTTGFKHSSFSFMLSLQCRCLWILKKKMNRFLPPSLLLCSPLLRWDGASPSFWGVPVWLSGGGQLKLLVAEKSDVENASFFYQWPLCGFPLPTGNIMTWM